MKVLIHNKDDFIPKNLTVKRKNQPTKMDGGKSFYEEGVFMCEPCFRAGGDQCVFSAPDTRSPNDLDYEDPHTYDEDYYKNREWYEEDNSVFPDAPPPPKPEPVLSYARMKAAGGSYGDPFPACSDDQITQCYFPEASNGLVDNCMNAVFDPLFQQQATGPGYAAHKVSQALTLRNQRVEQCPYFVCSTSSMVGGNGRMSFQASDCQCKK